MKLDVESVFKAKNPGVARFIPRFIFRWIARVIHQDDMNDYLAKYGHLDGIDFAHAAISEYNLKISTLGTENLPSEGRYLFVANHPLGGFDGVVLMSLIGKRYGTARFLVNDILMSIPNLRSVFLPINKHGANSRQAAEMINKAFESEMPLITFPAGLCSRKIDGVIKDLDWKNNFLKKTIEYKRDIIPVYVKAKNSMFFYNFAKLRKRLGLKVNIEMFLLPGEMYKFRNQKITFIFGKPISYHFFDKSKTMDEWREYVRSIVYDLDK